VTLVAAAVAEMGVSISLGDGGLTFPQKSATSFCNLFDRSKDAVLSPTGASHALQSRARAQSTLLI